MARDLKQINTEFDMFVRKLDPSRFDIAKIKTAYTYAKKAHAFQQRASGTPYISHPLEVAKIIAELGLDDISICCALLHDVVEDTEVSLEEVEKEFGEDVALIVGGLTKIGYFGQYTKEEKGIEALRKILLASSKDIRVLIIKLCDRLHNMRTLQNVKEEKAVRVATETMRIYVPIAQKVGLYSLKWELEDHAFKYINPEMYKFIKAKVNLTREEREEIVQKAVSEVNTSLTLGGVSNVSVTGRPKNFRSIYKKIKNKAKSFEDIYDLYAVRIVAKDIAECYSVLGVLHEKFQVFPDRLKDYIATPKANGYQSLHTVIYSSTIKGPVEVQIRTDEMNKLAEFGVAAHWRYKDVGEDKKFEKKIGWLREILQWEKDHQGDNTEFLQLLKFDFFEDEIFVFTPKNDVIVLPEGATGLDFAFSIHTDLGLKAQKIKVNGSISTIDASLKSGDIVQVITNAKVRPTEKWLKFVKTSKARIKIRNALNLKLSKRREVVNDDVSFDKLKGKILRIDEFKKVRKAGCCDFKYGDQIVGLVSQNGKELVVHSSKCENARYALNKKILLRWQVERDKEVTLYVILKDKIGLLMDILNVFSEMNISILKINSTTLKNGDGKMTIRLLDGPHVDRLMKKLKRLDSIVEVSVSRGLFFMM